MGEFLKKFQAYTSVTRDVFIETGSFQGASLGFAIAMGCFKEFHSIELATELSDVLRQRYAGQSNIHIYRGTSPDVLPYILPHVRSKAVLFWLDAHYQGLDPSNQLDSKYGECPLLQELDVIRAIKWLIPPLFVIDDARMFTKEFWIDGLYREKFRRDHWPLQSEIEAKLPGYKFTVDTDQLYCYQ